MRSGTICLVMALSALAGTAYAEDGQKAARSHLYGGYYYTHPDKDRGTEDHGSGWQLNLGYPVAEHWWIEGMYSDSTWETGPGQGTDFYTRGGGIDLQYGFGDRESITPFFLIGGGGMYNDVIPDRDDQFTGYGNVGVGVVGRIFDLRWLRLRAEARYIYDTYRDGEQDFRAGGGIEVALGGPDVVEKVVEVEKIVEVPVIKEVVREVPAQQLDSDHDGVLDQFDRCPDTLPGARVNAEGCVVEQQVIELKNVSLGFEFDSAKLTEFGRRALDPAIAFLKAQPEISAEVAGHTDAIGSEEYNQGLSDRRANAVRNFLIDNGIAPNRLRAQGYGESHPVATNETDEGRALNRRVELHIDAVQH